MLSTETYIVKERLPAPPVGRSELEIEVKFACDLSIFPKLLALVEPRVVAQVESKHLQSTYFDTPDLRLRSAGVSLRKRTDEFGNALWGIKSAVSGGTSTFDRIQHEVPGIGDQSDLSQFGPAIAHQLADLIGGMEILPQFVVDVQRQQLLINHFNSDIEIALDVGEVQSGDLRKQFFEIELELKAGNAHHLYDFALLLVNELLLTLSFDSKADRGFKLLNKDSTKWVMARPLPSMKNELFNQTMARAAANVIRHFTSNWSAFFETNEPEATHQKRAALRKFRDLADIYNTTFPLPDFTKLQQSAKYIGKTLGNARSLDVFRKSLPRVRALKGLEHRELEAVQALVEQHYSVAREKVHEMLNDRAPSQFVLQAQDSILQCKELSHGNHAAEIADEPSADTQMAEALRRLHGTILKSGKDFSKLSNKRLHKLRLKAKKMRHALDIHASISGRKSGVDTYVRSLAHLQKALGIHNDNIFALSLLRTLSHDAASDVKFCVKRLRRGLKRSDERQLEKLKSIWNVFKHTRPYW